MKHDTCQIGCFLQLLSRDVTKEKLWNACSVVASAFDDIDSLAVVQRLLRSFTSEWIDSGFAEDGSEHPLRRNFSPESRMTMPAHGAADGAKPLEQSAFRIPYAVQAMAKCVNGRVLVGALRGAESKYFISHENTGGGYGKPPHMFIEPGGGLSYRRAIELEQSRDCTEGTSEGRENKNHAEYLDVLAGSLFMEFYQSEWRFRLMRCQRCGVFVIPNRKPRKRYEYGWHCEKCRSAGTATAFMLRATKQHRERWLSLAAEASLRWRPEKGERSVWIAKEVNKKLGNDYRITRNSITRSAALIARMAEELGPHAVTHTSYDATDQGHLPSGR
jgi:hypothetical protein